MFLLAVYVVALLGAMGLSAVLTWCVREIARKKHWVRGPESDRHIHQQPVPRLGGVAIYLTFCAIIFFETAVVSFGFHLHRAESTGLVLRILMPATFMFCVGLLDDIFNIRAIVKLAVQIVSGIWLFELGCRVPISGVHFHGVDYSLWVSGCLTVVWVVMLSNAFNLIDGLDGLAAGASIFPLLTFSAAALFNHNGQMCVASLILTGSLLGFLRFNFNPATIFLGDSGSLFLGFTLSALSLAGSQAKAPTLLSVALPIVACGFPIAETFVSIMRRFLSGRPIFGADREHFHHRLLTLGFSHRQVVILLFAASGACSLLSVLLLFPKPEVFMVVGLVLALLITVGVGKLGYPEFLEIKRLIMRVSEQKSVIAQNVKLRQVAGNVQRAKDWDDVTHALRNGFQSGEFTGFDLGIYANSTYRSGKEALLYNRIITLEPNRKRVGWSITLEFEGGNMSGYLELLCGYKQQSLMLDVNVLLQVLAPALSHACQVISRESDQVRLLHESQRTVRSASVG